MDTIHTHTIETERLKLRILTPQVYQQLFETASDEEIKTFLGLDTDAALLNEAERYQDIIHSTRRSFVTFQMIHKTSQVTVGNCSYHTWILKHFRAEIGYAIAREEDKRQGYMKEAMKPIIQYGFETMGLNRIEALIGPGNAASLALVKGFGFAEEGLLREHYYKDDVVYDSYIFSLLRREYQAKIN